LHLVGILFPHINDDARSKSHQICNQTINQSTMYYQLKTDVTSHIWSDGIYSFQERIGVIKNDSLNIVNERQFKDA